MKIRFGKSISAKLNLWYTLLVAFVSVGLILTLITAARLSENSEAQQELIRSVERNIDEIEVENGLLDIETDFAYRNGEIYAVVYSADGEVLGGKYPEGINLSIPLEEERFDKFDGYYVYDTKVEFTKYDYKINGKTGEIISSEVEGADFYTAFGGDMDFIGENCDISCREAFAIALNKSGLDISMIDIINIKNYEYNDAPIYEIEFHSSEKAYEDIWVRGVVAANGVDGVWAIITRLAAILLPLLLIVSFLIGKFITGRALEPINRLRYAVEEIHGGKDLSKRVSLSDSDPLITSLAEKFNRMFSRLQLSFENEKQFSGDVSHELRTPTAVILAESEYQLSRPELDQEDREGFETIQKQAETMKILISQLLEMARLEKDGNEITKEKEDFSILVSTVCDDAYRIDKKNITLKRDIDDGLTMDMEITLMTRLVTNLISNAYKYGKENGNITVRLKKHSELIRLSVEDDGEGIAPEHIDKIWNRFYRVDKARCREEGCSGLGLAMVRQIASVHNGEAYAESTPGKGSIFTVDFRI